MKKIFLILFLFLTTTLFSQNFTFINHNLLYYLQDVLYLDVSEQELINRYGEERISSQMSLSQLELILFDLEIEYIITSSERFQELWDDEKAVLVQIDPTAISETPYRKFEPHYILVHNEFQDFYICFEPYTDQITFYQKEELISALQGDMLVLEK